MFITYEQAIYHLLLNKGKFSAYLGAGASVSAGVKSARHICNEIRDILIANNVIPESDIDEHLQWDNTQLRYYNCIKHGLSNEASRVDYFKRLLEGKKPSFVHYGTSLLISNNFLKNVCITTNFDKLLELAFFNIGEYECQAIRMEEETKFLSLNDNRKSYVLKLHGDYDTNNILNTREETKQINPKLLDITKTTLKDSGLLVIGTAGYEKSIHTMFDLLTNKESQNDNVLPYGLLWGVYMGNNKPEKLTKAENEALLKAQIKSDTVCDEIVSMIGSANKNNPQVSFFPIWGADEFIFDLINRTADRKLIKTSELYLNHDMRLRYVLTKAKLTPTAIDNHLKSLEERKVKFESQAGTNNGIPECAFIVTNSVANYEMRICYGDITKRAFLSFEEAPELTKVVVSPDDTFLSAGGGVAYSLMQKGGKIKILNELYKFSPLKKTEIAVTSGFDLPVHHIFHTASIEIDKNANYSITQASLKTTVRKVLTKFNNLNANVLFIPLIGSGLANLTANESFQTIFDVLINTNRRPQKRYFNIVISEEKRIGRETIKEKLKDLDPSIFSVRVI